MNLDLSKIFGPLATTIIASLPIQASAIGYCSADAYEGNTSQLLVQFVKNTLPSDVTWVCTAQDEAGAPIYVVQNKNDHTYSGYALDDQRRLCRQLLTIEDLDQDASLAPQQEHLCTLSMM